MLRSPYGRNGLRFCVGLLGVVALGMFIAAATAIVERPRTYRALADHGVPTLATAFCGGDGCELTYSFAGRRYSNDYSRDLTQFCRCPAATPVLVDPSHPATMFTVRDVQRGTNAGLGVYSIATMLIGLALGGFAVFCFITLRKLPRHPPPPPSPPGWDASAIARALYAIEQVQELLDAARPLPGVTWYRVDPAELAARVAEMRRTITQLPGPRAQALDTADRVARVVDAAPRIPVIGGARVRAFDLSAQLDEVQLAVIEAMRTGSSVSA
jgi:hypothetical protein